jgi:Xaa-Pro aminopeptidase
VERLSAVAQADPFGLGHGVGIDEGSPVIRLDSDETLRAGSAISVHPFLTDTERSLRVSIANTLYITDEGPMPLSIASHSIRVFS